MECDQSLSESYLTMSSEVSSRASFDQLISKCLNIKQFLHTSCCAGKCKHSKDSKYFIFHIEYEKQCDCRCLEKMKARLCNWQKDESMSTHDLQRIDKALENIEKHLILKKRMSEKDESPPTGKEKPQTRRIIPTPSIN